MSSTKPSNTSLAREEVDEEAVEEMLVDIEQAAKRKDLLIERMREMEKRDAEILRVSLNHDIATFTAFNLHVVNATSK